ncbi:hypothetical protein [Bacillus sp. AK031]
MKRIFFCSALLCLLLTGCKTKEIAVPPSLDGQLMVSHLKEPALSFVNLQDHKITEGNLDFRITAMQKTGPSRVIIAGENEKYLFELDLKDGSYKELVDAGTGINDLLYIPERQLLIFSNGEENTVGVFDLMQEKIIAEVPVGTLPISMAYNPDQETVFVVNAKGPSLSVIDLEAMKMEKEFQIAERPNGIYYDGEYVWIGGHGEYGTLNKEVYVYDPGSGKEVDRVETGVMPVDFYGDVSNPYFYVVCHGSSSVYQINKQTREVSSPIEVGSNPYDIIGDSKRIYVSSIDGNSLTVINQSTFEIEESIPLENGPHLMILGERNE